MKKIMFTVASVFALSGAQNFAPTSANDNNDGDQPLDYNPGGPIINITSPDTSYNPGGPIINASEPITGYNPGGPIINASQPITGYNPGGPIINASEPITGYNPGGPIINASQPITGYNPGGPIINASKPITGYNPGGPIINASKPITGYNPGGPIINLTNSTSSSQSSYPKAPQPLVSPQHNKTHKASSSKAQNDNDASSSESDSDNEQCTIDFYANGKRVYREILDSNDSQANRAEFSNKANNNIDEIKYNGDCYCWAMLYADSYWGGHSIGFWTQDPNASDASDIEGDVDLSYFLSYSQETKLYTRWDNYASSYSVYCFF